MRRRLNNKKILPIIKVKAKEKDMKLKDIDEAMGMKEGYLSTIVSKKRGLFGLDVLYSVAEALECDIRELLTPLPEEPKEAAK